ncbi:MAG: family 10 glycosylhydrolase [Prevotellaceae bacterium]|nr:family 10 glycosylhydrolase [Prevotellaceae bacterium]
MKRVALLVYMSLSVVVAGCAGNNNDPNNGKEPQIPIVPGTGEPVDKPRQLWIDAHANLSRFNHKETITNYMERIKEAGFTEIYLDVKPGIGHALYDSDILPKLTRWGSVAVDRDWDYLGFFIEEAERLEIGVIASISTLGFGVTATREGPAYENARWEGKTQMEMIGNDPNTIVDMRDQSGVDAVMLNPCIPEVQTFVISIVEEIVTKYPKLKGVCLDYCRWYGGNYGFGDATIAAFEAYSGEQVRNKNDIVTATGGIGPLYKKWIAFRTMTITNLVTNIRTAVKAIRPDVEFHLWASAHWKSRYSVGQNWASKNYAPTPSGVYTDTYRQTGFADQLDVFSLGAYAEYVWIAQNPGSDWTVENFVTSYSQYTMGDCKVYGSMITSGYATDRTAISDAVYLCLKNTDGLMVFELSHVINHNQWDAIKEGIGRVIK